MSGAANPLPGIDKQAALFPVTTGRDPAGQMTIAGHSLCDLASQYGTPLYLYDAATVYAQVNILRDLLARLYAGRAEVAYAAKAAGVSMYLTGVRHFYH